MLMLVLILNFYFVERIIENVKYTNINYAYNLFLLIKGVSKSFDKDFHEYLEETLDKIRNDEKNADLYVSKFVSLSYGYKIEKIDKIKFDSLQDFEKKRLNEPIDYFIYKNVFSMTLEKIVYIRVNNIVYIIDFTLPLDELKVFVDSIRRLQNLDFIKSFGIYSNDMQPILGTIDQISDEQRKIFEKVVKTGKIVEEKNKSNVTIYAMFDEEDKHEKFGPIFVVMNLDFSIVYNQAYKYGYLFFIVLIMFGIYIRFVSVKFSKQITFPFSKIIGNMKNFLDSRIYEQVDLQNSKIDELNDLFYSYNKMVEQTSSDIESQKVLIKEVEEAYVHFATKLSEVAEIYDEQTGNHIERVGILSAFLALKLNLSKDFIKRIRIYAPLHDIGKIKIPRKILMKKSKLTDQEWELIKTHTIYGAELIGDKPHLKIARNIALYHHENYDGSGYPKGLKGNDIPIEAAIVKICDVYDALRSKRPYKDEMSHKEALKVIVQGDMKTNPKHFNPEVLKVFIENEKIIGELWDKVYRGINK
ncbi:HD domain-containing phosphohydrolase [Thermosipho atlanticus]|nr:HD domain-containing phosphohydrolase [Thermosipho atlanticus]